MASETGPDLTVARTALEALMDDACVIVRYEEASEDTLDLGTGMLTAPPGEPVTIYDQTTVGDAGRSLADEGATGGRCKVAPTTESQPRLTQEGGVPITPRPYKIMVPWDTPELIVGDIVTVASSRRDPQLPGTNFIVRDVLRSTMLVARRAIVERRL